MLIECVVCNGCRPGETSERTEQFAKDTWITAKNTNLKMTNKIIQLKDERMEEIMDYFPYFPFSDWIYETNIYELVYTEIEARVWKKLILILIENLLRSLEFSISSYNN